jgi:hypothetical protein
MKVNRRRSRRSDPFASAEWVRLIFEKLKAAFPLLFSCKEKDLIKLARAIRHVERYSATDTKRGRPSRWPREDIVKAGLKLSQILVRETGARISVATFVDHYMRILDFPADVLTSLSNGEINLFEAEQLARVTATRIHVSQAEAKRKRAECLSAHIISRSSGDQLRRRVNEFLLSPKFEEANSGNTDYVIEPESELEKFDSCDSTHLLWEQIKQLGFAFRNISREDVTDEDIEQLIEACDPVINILTRIQRRKQPTRNPLIF